MLAPNHWNHQHWYKRPEESRAIQVLWLYHMQQWQ
ncbi:hypothetical protein NXF25_005964 [Crotalus adamanteus]|uniref:Uncharacterized protein n=1 Tax=Crotalus adamanteus TaxID=8729 RepID=A0AAW1C0G9_CROAD